jgi:hypothetical protein
MWPTPGPVWPPAGGDEHSVRPTGALTSDDAGVAPYGAGYQGAPPAGQQIAAVPPPAGDAQRECQLRGGAVPEIDRAEQTPGSAKGSRSLPTTLRRTVRRGESARRCRAGRLTGAHVCAWAACAGALQGGSSRTLRARSRVTAPTSPSSSEGRAPTTTSGASTTRSGTRTRPGRTRRCRRPPCMPCRRRRPTPRRHTLPLRRSRLFRQQRGRSGLPRLLQWPPSRATRWRPRLRCVIA